MTKLYYTGTLRVIKTRLNHFLQIKFKGDKKNINGLGAVVTFIMITANNRFMKIIRIAVIYPACRVLRISG